MLQFVLEALWKCFKKYFSTLYISAWKVLTAWSTFISACALLQALKVCAWPKPDYSDCVTIVCVLLCYS